MDSSERVLFAKNVIKRFPGTIALKGVDFELKAGEVRGLLGKNGAGKSTLISILAGLTKKTEGDIYYFGKKADVGSVEESESLGFRFVAQEYSLMQDLSVAENIAFREKELFKQFKFIEWKKILESAKEKLSVLDLNIDPKLEVLFLKPAEKQMVLLVREIFSKGSKIVALDEATTALSLEEKEKVYNVIRTQKQKDQSFIFVSHEIDEVFEICDHVTVVRDGLVVLDENIKNLTHSDLKKAIAGFEVSKMQNGIDKDNKDKEEKVILSLNNISNAKLKNISFDLNEGEILGVYGFRGSGRTELLKTIYGLLPVEKGFITYKDKILSQRSQPSDLIQKGINFIPEDRSEGIFFGRPVIENMLTSASIATKKLRSKLRFFISSNKESSLFSKVAADLQIKTPSPNAEIDYLSGGNKQKVIFGRSLACDSKILLVDEGTKGIDIGAKSEIYEIMKNLTKVGCSVIFTSSDLDEICNISERIVVMHEGNIMKILTKQEISKEKLLHYADGLN